MAKKEIYLPVAEVMSDADGAFSLRIKGQYPGDECLLRSKPPKGGKKDRDAKLKAFLECLKLIHEAKKRGGTVWVRYKAKGKNLNLTDGEVVIRDLLE